MGAKQSIFKYCEESLKSRKVLKNLLSDLFAGNRLAINVTLVAFDAGIIEMIDSARILDDEFRARTVKYITRNYGITEVAAKAAVKFWITQYAEKYAGKVRDTSATLVYKEITQEQNFAHSRSDSRREITFNPGHQKRVRIDELVLNFCWCPPGEFFMGSHKDERGRDNDEFLHKVVLNRGFWILETPVTQKMWSEVVGPTAWQQQYSPRLKSSYSEEGPDLPMCCVDWKECNEFCRKLSLLAGKELLLPTEAQWEYACRAGLSSNGSIDVSHKYEMGWFYENSKGTLHKVKDKIPNAWGIYDMLGNVYEWCSDWYSSRYYENSPQIDPCGPLKGSTKVVRGGSFTESVANCSEATRQNLLTRVQDKDLGFRFVMITDVADY